MLKRWTRHLGALWIGALLLALPVEANAQDELPCDSLTHPVYMMVGSTVLPLIRTLGRALRDTTDPVTLVFIDGRSCAMIDAISSGTKLTTNLTYVPSSAEDPAWTPELPPRTCTVDAAGVDLDMIHSDVYVESCTATPPPDGVAAFAGPILPFVFVVPEASSQVAITAEEAYFVWGFGAAGQIAPWTHESFLFTRPNTSGTKITFGANFGVPASRWKGVQLEKTSDVINAVASSVNVEATLAIVGGANFDSNRDKLNALAFKAFGQNLAFYPDSTPTTFDKQNVRDGHYGLWGPAIFVARVGQDGRPANAGAALLLNLLQSRPVTPDPGFDATATIVDLGFIPDCAMRVSRASQGGEFSPYTPAAPCHCFFEERVGASSGTCTACTDDAACGGGSCNLGFCED